MKVILPFATAVLSFVAAWFILNWIHDDAASKAEFARIKVRPIAEYEPTFGIGVSEQLLFKKNGLAFVRAVLSANTRIYVLVSADRRDEVNRLLRSQNLLNGMERENIIKIQLEHESMWTRDYFPVPILRVIPHMVPTPSFVDFVYRDGNSLDDAAIHQFALAINSSIEHLPLVLDGGNFMTNGETCILSNEVSEDPEILLLNSPEPPLESNLEEIFRAVLGCRRTIMVSQLPHPHVDMWMKFLDAKTIAVNRVDLSSLDAPPALRGGEREKALSIAQEFDRVAKRLSEDFKVVRLPMPAPRVDLFMTYANAVLANGKAIVPRYSKALKPEALGQARLLEGYERDAEAIYRKAGYEVEFIDANELIEDGGAFHCVTFHLPDLDVIRKERGYSAIRPNSKP